jgi:hypothetical protein
MNEIIQRSILAMVISLAMLGGLGFRALHAAPGLPSMTPPAAPELSDHEHAGAIGLPTPTPRPGYP